MKKKNIGIIGANPISGNRGVNALAYSALFLLKETERKKGVEFNIFFLEPQFSQGEIEIDLAGDKIKVATLPLFLLEEKGNWFKAVFKRKQYAKTIWGMDYILDISGGDSFSDIYGWRRFSKVVSTKKLYGKLKKPQFLLPQTIGPFKEEKSKIEATKALSNFSYIYARDRKSFDLAKEMLPGRDIKELIDMAFFMPYTPQALPGNTLKIGVNVSALLWHGGYEKNNQFGLVDDYEAMTRKLIDNFLKFNADVYLVAHVVSEAKTVENDYWVCKKLCDELNNSRVKLAPFFLDPIDAKSYISGFDFFTGARMHACIASFSSGVPTYPLAYSRKFTGLFVDTLGYPHCGDLTKDSTDKIIAETSAILNNLQVVKNEVKHILEETVYPKKKVIVDDLTNFLQ